MKMNKLILLTCSFFASASFLCAQSYESSAKWDKKSEPCVSITVNAPEDIAIESLYSLLKSDKLKGKKSGKTLKFEKIIFPSISTDYLNIYATVDTKDNNSSTINVFVNRGEKSDFVTGNTDRTLVENLKSYLNTRYEPAAAKASYNSKVDAQRNLIKESEKDLKKMQSDLDKKVKQKAKLESEIEDLTKQIASQGLLINQQNADLKKISQ
jgi:hypothetical protein